MLVVWADNADACAKQYAGTGALKTDFTRSVFTLQNYYAITLATCILVTYWLLKKEKKGMFC